MRSQLLAQNGKKKEMAENPTEDALLQIIRDHGAFREEAAILLAGLEKPEAKDRSLYEDALLELHAKTQQGEWKAALSLIRTIQERKDRNPFAIEFHEARRAILRTAWHLVRQARGWADWEQYDEARAQLQRVIDQFPGTRSAARAKKELEELP